MSSCNVALSKPELHADPHLKLRGRAALHASIIAFWLFGFLNSALILFIAFSTAATSVEALALKGTLFDEIVVVLISSLHTLLF